MYSYSLTPSASRDVAPWKRSIARLVPLDAHLFSVVGRGRAQAKAPFDKMLHSFARLQTLCTPMPPTTPAESSSARRFDALTAAKLSADVHTAVHEFTTTLETARVPAINYCRSELDEIAKRAQAMSVTASFLVDCREAAGRPWS